MVAALFGNVQLAGLRVGGGVGGGRLVGIIVGTDEDGFTEGDCVAEEPLEDEEAA